MKKVLKDTRTLLFENMIKLNSDFKLNEDNNWIQKAVDPEHKGFCSPMTKSTCTPKRKALAMRFKKGIENESFDLNQFSLNPEEYKKKAEKIKQTIDNLFSQNDFDIIDNMYKLFVSKKTKNTSDAYDLYEDHSPEYQKKTELIKGKIDFLFDNDYYDIIDNINNIIDKLFPNDESELELDECK